MAETVVKLKTKLQDPMGKQGNEVTKFYMELVGQSAFICKGKVIFFHVLSILTRIHYHLLIYIEFVTECFAIDMGYRARCQINIIAERLCKLTLTLHRFFLQNYPSIQMFICLYLAKRASFDLKLCRQA